MIRFILIALLLLGAAIGFTLLAQHDSGYVLINYSGWSMETSFSIFALALLLGFLAFYLSLRLLFGTLHLPGRLVGWRRHQQAEHARVLTNKGLIALAEGDWKRAEKKLSRSAAHSDTPLINYLGAARAAQKQDAEQRRDDYLSQAYQSMPDAELAVGLTQADVQLSQGQAEQALATLNHLRSIAPKHVYVLYLLKKLYETLESWDDLNDLLPELHKHHVLEPEQHAALQHRVQRKRLQQCQTLEQLEQAWQSLPQKLHHDAELLEVYATALQQMDAEQQAEAVLHGYLKKHWDSNLMRLYGLLQGEDPQRQMAIGEQWLKEHEHHPELLLALGRLALYNQLWGKARSYLEASMGMDPRAETCCELGNLLSQLGEKERAAEYYRQGLEMSCEGHCSEFTVTDSDHLHPLSNTAIGSEQGEA